MAIILLIVFTVRLFILPTTDTPGPADAIVMFEGPGDRHSRTLELARAGYAPVLVVSSPGLGWCPVDEVSGVEVICFSPDPVTTRGEARAVARLAAQRGWSDLIFVTGHAQNTRARMRIGRCYHGELRVTTVKPRRLTDWPTTLAYEWGALAKALIWQRGC